MSAKIMKTFLNPSVLIIINYETNYKVNLPIQPGNDWKVYYAHKVNKKCLGIDIFFTRKSDNGLGFNRWPIFIGKVMTRLRIFRNIRNKSETKLFTLITCSNSSILKYGSDLGLSIQNSFFFYFYYICIPVTFLSSW